MPLRLNNSRLHGNSEIKQKNLNFSLSNSDLENHRIETSSIKEDDTSFLEILSRIQSNRLDDQRCTIKRPNNENHITQKQKPTAGHTTVPDEDFFNLIVKSQKSRLEDQRYTFSKTPKSKSTTSAPSTFADMSMTTTEQTAPLIPPSQSNFKNQTKVKQACTIPADDAFFSMIQKIQSNRLDEQRTNLKSSLFSFNRKK